MDINSYDLGDFGISVFGVRSKDDDGVVDTDLDG